MPATSARKTTRITIEHAAKLLDVSVSRVRQLRAEGQLTGYKSGTRQLRFDECQVLELKRMREQLEPAPVHWNVRAG
jgi:excisionase family DNA binding protein